MVEINGIEKGKLENRLDNYLREIDGIEERVDGGRISSNTEEKLIFRYLDIKNRLMPNLTKEMKLF